MFLIAAEETLLKFLTDVFNSERYPILPKLQCDVCGKQYVRAATLKEHKSKKHQQPPTVSNPASEDEICEHTYYLLRLLLLKCNMDDAIHHGDGARLINTIKHMFLYFRANGNYKYALACFELIASLEYFVDEKTKLALIQDRFVNMRGAPDSNYPADLLVEHSNKIFKDNFHLYRGTVTQNVLDRFSKSQTQTTKVLDNFQQQFAIGRYVGTHKQNTENLQNDLEILFASLSSQQLFSSNNRKLRCLSIKTVDAVATLDPHKLLDWMYATIEGMRTYTYLK